MNKFLDNTEYIFWTLGASLAGIHLGLIFSINILTITAFLFLAIYGIVLMTQSYMKKSL